MFSVKIVNDAIKKEISSVERDNYVLKLTIKELKKDLKKALSLLTKKQLRLFYKQ